MTVEEHEDGGCKAIFTPETDTEEKVLKLFILSGDADAILNCIETTSSLSIGLLRTQQSTSCCDLTCEEV
jgi:hypothetical protein